MEEVQNTWEEVLKLAEHRNQANRSFLHPDNSSLCKSTQHNYLYSWCSEFPCNDDIHNITLNTLAPT